MAQRSKNLTPVVIDNGTGYSKFGFAGEDQPLSSIRTIVGLPKCQIGKKPRGLGFYAGSSVPPTEDVLRKRPVTHGVVTDWDVMEMLWHHIFYMEMKVAPEDQPVLITDSPSSPTTNREKAAELLFEAFGVPAMYVAHTSLLSLYSCGRINGLVIDAGAGLSCSSPIHEGYLLPHATYRLDIAGRVLTNHLMRLLAANGNFFTPNERKIVKDIKERCCYVSLHYENEMASTNAHYMVDYHLPDGQFITIGSERFRCPEAIFKPKLLGLDTPGLHILAYKSLGKVDPAYKADIMRSVVICGGSSMFQGFPERIQKELVNLCPSGSRLTVLTPPQRKNAAWRGGSIIASLKSFQSMWMQQKDYYEKGPVYVHRKCI
ncbi:actin-like [Latimeria chalumnae]|uniref:Uncharacterized protein n=1 Tax=Latimeria chalumnae TaxID=7897 RepID=H3AKB6_LATCH|nr:PREDICTED: actin-like [Latimeria chalumnae]|eukprot:XP_006003731.1 PREDICTED: actin-like [Latimeria chalumnae]